MRKRKLSKITGNSFKSEYIIRPNFVQNCFSKIIKPDGTIDQQFCIVSIILQLKSSKLKYIIWE